MQGLSKPQIPEGEGEGEGEASDSRVHHQNAHSCCFPLAACLSFARSAIYSFEPEILRLEVVGGGRRVTTVAAVP